MSQSFVFSDVFEKESNFNCDQLYLLIGAQRGLTTFILDWIPFNSTTSPVFSLENFRTSGFSSVSLSKTIEKGKKSLSGGTVFAGFMLRPTGNSDSGLLEAKISEVDNSIFDGDEWVSPELVSLSYISGKCRISIFDISSMKSEPLRNQKFEDLSKRLFSVRMFLSAILFVSPKDEEILIEKIHRILLKSEYLADGNFVSLSKPLPSLTEKRLSRLETNSEELEHVLSEGQDEQSESSVKIEMDLISYYECNESLKNILEVFLADFRNSFRVRMSLRGKNRFLPKRMFLTNKRVAFGFYVSSEESIVPATQELKSLLGPSRQFELEDFEKIKKFRNENLIEKSSAKGTTPSVQVESKQNLGFFFAILAILIIAFIAKKTLL